MRTRPRSSHPTSRRQSTRRTTARKQPYQKRRPVRSRRRKRSVLGSRSLGEIRAAAAETLASGGCCLDGQRAPKERSPDQAVRAHTHESTEGVRCVACAKVWCERQSGRRRRDVRARGREQTCRGRDLCGTAYPLSSTRSCQPMARRRSLNGTAAVARCRRSACGCASRSSRRASCAAAWPTLSPRPSGVRSKTARTSRRDADVGDACCCSRVRAHAALL